MKTLSNRLKKLEPKTNDNIFFGALSENDPHIFHKADHRYFASYTIYGYRGNQCLCYDGGYVDTVEEGISKLKKALREYTFNVCDILHIEHIDGKSVVKTFYELEGMSITDKYPQGINAFS